MPRGTVSTCLSRVGKMEEYQHANDGDQSDDLSESPEGEE